MVEANDLKAQLAHFTGSETFMRHGLNPRVVMTDGVVFLAENAGAHWLMDIIVSHQIDKRVQREEFQVWKLRLIPKGDVVVVPYGHDGDVTLSGGRFTAVIYMTDGNDDKAIIHQAIEYTDFPLDEIDLWCVRGNPVHTIMLPSEY